MGDKIDWFFLENGGNLNTSSVGGGAIVRFKLRYVECVVNFSFFRQLKLVYNIINFLYNLVGPKKSQTYLVINTKWDWLLSVGFQSNKTQSPTLRTPEILINTKDSRDSIYKSARGLCGSRLTHVESVKKIFHM